MTSTPAKPRQSRSTRREALLSATAQVVGGLTLILAVAFVVYVAIGKLWHSPATDPAYQEKTTSLREHLKLCDWQDGHLTLKLYYPNPKSRTPAVRIAGTEGHDRWILQNTRS